MLQLREGNAIHVFSGTEAAPGTYIGSVAALPNEGAISSAEVAKRLGIDGSVRARKRSFRMRVTLAQVNAGLTLLPAIANVQYRMADCQIIAIGGAAAAGTTVDILGTQATASVKLAAFAQASLTQSTVLRPGIAGCAVLADGASFVACDVNTAITISKTGSAFTTATNFDVQFEYEEIVA